ncbi:MAG: Jag N-terminal domain-containing protein, partial [Clostridium luticellarii]
MKKIYEGISLEECLKSASREMNTPVDKLGYNILKEKKSFFKKKKIVVEIFESNVKEEVTPSEKKEVVSSGEKAQNFGIDQNNGSIKVVHGEIIVKNPKEDGKPAMIYKSKGMTILVDGVEVEDRCEVFEHSDIKVNFYENESKRELNIYVSDDRMSAYLEVRYTPKNKYVLKDEEESQKLSFKA